MTDVQVTVLHPAEVKEATHWIAEGAAMARKEGAAALESIETKHVAETSTCQTHAVALKAKGQTVLKRRDELDKTLVSACFNLAEHLKDLVQGKLDLAWAIGLAVLNAALALFVLLAFGPTWITIPLALLVLVTALPVEEFFQAHDERDAVREGLFLAISFLALVAQFWLGTIRGIFLAALAQVGDGPTTEALGAAGLILKWTLGILAAASEVLCGYKLYRARKQLLSPTVRAVRERDRCNNQLILLSTSLEAAKTEPDIRRAYRQIGARQFLAWQAGAEQRTRRNHLRRASVGALIAVLTLLAVFLLLGSKLHAGTPAGRNVVILTDFSTSVSRDNFQANLGAVSAVVERLKPGDRIVIAGITDSFGNPMLLLDRRMPAVRGYLSFEAQVGRETIRAEWKKELQELSARRAFPWTDILGALAWLSYFGDLTDSEAPLILFLLSDMRHSVPDLDFEKFNVIPAKEILDRLQKEKSIPRLRGARVFLLGVDPLGKTAAYLASLKEFWLCFFDEAGAEVHTFSVNRTIPEF